MSLSYIDDSLLTDIADEIRTKGGTVATMTPAEMATAIANLPSGGGGDIPDLMYKLIQQGSKTAGTPDQSTFTRTNLAGITSVRPYAFYGAGMIGTYDAIFPDVTGLGMYAFSYSPVHEITFDKRVTQVSGYEFAFCSELVKVNAPNGLKLSSSMFSSCAHLASVPNFIPGTNYENEIPQSCFNGCQAIPAITIPSGVKYIKSGAFQNCSSLASVTMQTTTLMQIQNSAFRNTALTSFTVPSTVTFLGTDTFRDCAHLESLTLLHSGNFSQGTCINCAALETVDWTPSATGTINVMGSDSATNAPFYGCPNLQAWIIRANTPPTLRGTYLWSASGNAVQGGWPSSGAYIYVPDDYVNTYKTATNWATFANYIKPISELPAS